MGKILIPFPVFFFGPNHAVASDYIASLVILIIRVSEPKRPQLLSNFKWIIVFDFHDCTL